jgi:hypothetical protein
LKNEKKIVCHLVSIVVCLLKALQTKYIDYLLQMESKFLLRSDFKSFFESTPELKENDSFATQYRMHIHKIFTTSSQIS